MFAASRLSRRLPALRGIAKRSYTDSRVAGATANSREFSKKEKAHEDQYIRQHEQAQLEKLRKLIEKQEADLANLKKQVEDQGKKVNGGSSQ